MNLFNLICFCCIYIFICISGTLSADEINIDDLLNPEIQSRVLNMKNDISIKETNRKKLNIDEMLGPPDNFPFLPDNHRDAGTGKFNKY